MRLAAPKSLIRAPIFTGVDFLNMGIKKIILSADSSCDLGDELKNRYDVHYTRFHILLDERSYIDGMNLSASDIFSTYQQKRCLPKTAAISVSEYYEHFKRWTDQGFEVVHINISSAVSSTYHNCCLAASELTGVYPIDSKNLTIGMGMLVIEAAKRIEQGLSAKEIQSEITALADKVRTGFVLDTLEFLCAGGRCSALAAMGANILKLKPCIEVDTATGTMSLVKKYRGALDKVLFQFVDEKLASAASSIDTERVFIPSTMQSPELVEAVREHVIGLGLFKEVHVAEVSCTISAHCGPNALGLVFLQK